MGHFFSAQFLPEKSSPKTYRVLTPDNSLPIGPHQTPSESSELRKLAFMNKDRAQAENHQLSCGEPLPHRNRKPQAAFTPAQELEFTRLYDEHWSWTLAKAAWFGVSDFELAASKAMHKAFLALPKYGGEFKTLLSVILRWELKTAYRNDAAYRRAIGRLAEGVDVADETTLRQLHLSELNEEIEAALSRLSPQERELIRQLYEEDLAYKEIQKQA